jgi:hypothetical protein
MLNWFNTSKIDHPLAAAKESARVVDDLPRDPFKALEEISFWLDSVNTTTGFRLDRRLELAGELDLAARTHLRKLAQDYLQVRQRKFHEHRLWSVLTRFWQLAGEAYDACIEGYRDDAPGAGAIRQRLALVVGRALHARGQRLKWLLLRYGPIESVLWGDLGRLQLFAESKAIADSAVTLYDGMAASSASQELTRALMLAAASTESLLPEQIDLAERSVAWFAPRVALAAAPQSGCTHVFDCAMRQPPQRHRGGARDASVRYLDPGDACAEIARLLRILDAEGVLPSDIALGADADPAAVGTVWRHLLQYWQASPPERRYQRRPVNVRLTVISGFDALMDALEGTRAATLDFSDGQPAAGPESWVAQDASDGGYGALVPAAPGDWLGIGALVALRAEGETRWGAGVVRRVQRSGEQEYRLGIERLARVAYAIRLAPSGVISSFNATRDNDPGVLLTPKPDAERQVRLLLRSGTYTAGQALEIRVRGQVYEAHPARLVESGRDYDLAVFTILRRMA